MSNKDFKKSEGVERLEIVLRPCINVVYGDAYKTVLEKSSRYIIVVKVLREPRFIVSIKKVF